MTQYVFGGDTLVFEYSSDSGSYVSDYIINGVTAVVEFGGGVWKLNNADGQNYGRSTLSYSSADDACPSEIAWEIWSGQKGQWVAATVLCTAPWLFTSDGVYYINLRGDNWSEYYPLKTDWEKLRIAGTPR